MVRFNYDWDWSRAERGFQRAIELDLDYPNAHHWYADYLSAIGRHDQAVTESSVLVGSIHSRPSSTHGLDGVTISRVSTTLRSSSIAGRWNSTPRSRRRTSCWDRPTSNKDARRRLLPSCSKPSISGAAVLFMSRRWRTLWPALEGGPTLSGNCGGWWSFQRDSTYRLSRSRSCMQAWAMPRRPSNGWKKGSMGAPPTWCGSKKIHVSTLSAPIPDSNKSPVRAPSIPVTPIMKLKRRCVAQRRLRPRPRRLTDRRSGQSRSTTR